ncbi:LysE family translocator [Limibaculum sp. M0105]|uniref:LysE family translocator n=1 Tax=Thermohalobaculum xanthum TaxID=2753746 RepID=A0A8J7M8W6_9RHOB|nr:LysE family translocator [Thermohalobaculum xanthum]MBK0400375.1 LysE family translocator [Thermohalobaculum xanthum]
MGWETIIALAGFALASTWTPGPNNMMLASSGATFGFRRTLPHALGVALGFPVMLFLIALGLGEAFKRAPAFGAALGWVGCGVMLWLAWRIATARAAGSRRRPRPLSFAEASAFQWINPKAWVMSIGVSASFATGARPVLEAAVAAGIFVLSGLSSAPGWAAFGAGLGRLLGDGWRLRAFNIAMAALLAASALWLVLDA